MLRHIYRCALRLHPPGFRRRFGDEMLSIFEQAGGPLTALRLLLDGIVSLFRQWALRPEFWLELPQNQPISEGVPSFSSLDPFRPRAAAVIHGMVLSITLFCATCFAIRYSWIHVLHVHIPEVVFESHSALSPSASPTGFRGTPTISPDQKPTLEHGTATSHLYVEPIPVETTDFSPASSVKIGGQNTVSTLGPGPSTAAFEIRVEAYRGVYVSHTPKLMVAITVRDGQLLMDMAGKRCTLSPLSRTTFLGDNYLQIEFGAERAGKFQQLQFSLGGQPITAERR